MANRARSRAAAAVSIGLPLGSLLFDSHTRWWGLTSLNGPPPSNVRRPNLGAGARPRTWAIPLRTMYT